MRFLDVRNMQVGYLKNVRFLQVFVRNQHIPLADAGVALQKRKQTF
ncbi:hypothetical protein PORCAN_532 [Porphyromonas crevioricanis JCM 13913]|nr:hypothetical protein PORCAN_532 [Porphyromonas crevioricanis JCM 13913]